MNVGVLFAQETRQTEDTTSSFSQVFTHAVKSGIENVKNFLSHGGRGKSAEKLGGRYLDRIYEPEDIVITSDIIYGSAPNKTGEVVELGFDLYTPPLSDTETLRPLVVIIHGGGFSGGDKASEKMIEWSQSWFAERGYVAASINYRLRNGEENIATKEAMSDAQAAVRFIRAHATEYGIDPNKIFTMGASAGAITSLMVGVSSEIAPLVLEEKYPQVKANFSNPDEPSWVCMAVSTSGAIDDGYRNKYLDEFDSPSVDFHGELDTTVPFDEAVETIEDMQALGIFAELYSYPDKAHGVDQDDVEEKIFPIFYEHVVSGECPAENMIVPEIEIDIDEPEVDVDDPPSNGGGGGGGSKNTPSNIVLPAIIEPVLAVPTPSAAACTPYLSGFVQYGDSRNNPEDVKKLEQFLNMQGETLVVDGVYGPLDRDAVNRFQIKYASDVLSVWGLSAPTGGVYRTTWRKINELSCPTFTPTACPAFTEINSIVNNTTTPEVYNTKLILKSLGYEVGPLTQTFDVPLKNALIAFQQTFHEIMPDPWGLTVSYGNKGALTNKLFNELVGCPSVPPVTI